MQPNSNSRILAVGSLALLGMLTCWYLGSIGSPAPAQDVATKTTTPSLEPADAVQRGAIGEQPAVERVPTEHASTATEVRITCVWATDGAPAVAIPVHAHRVASGRPLRPTGSVATDASGVVTFHGLPPEEHEFGALRITTRAVPVAGRSMEATIRLPQVAEVRGIVVDTGRAPAAGAVIAGEVGHVPQPIATADADGRFLIRLAAPGLIWATREGHGPSRMHQVDADVAHLELQLTAAGRTLAGTVVDPDGRAVPHAAVSIATDLEVGHGHPATAPVMLTANAHGEFATTQVPHARLIVFASAEGFAFGRQDADTTAADHVNMTVRLRRAATIHGVLLGGETRDVPQAGTLVEARRESLLPGLLNGTSGRLTRMFALSDPAGRYRLTGVPPGRVSITTWDASKAPFHHSAMLQEGQDYEWSPNLSPPPGVIRGTLLGPDGEALAGMHLRATRFDPVQVQEQTSATETDARGQFELLELRPLPHTLTVHSSSRSEPFAQRIGVLPDGPLFVWRLTGLPSQSGAILGRVLDPDGLAITDATYRAFSEGIALSLIHI